MIPSSGPSRGLVLVAEHNDAMREAIGDLLDAAGFTRVVYANAHDLMAGGRVEEAICVISDIKLPGASGLQLLARLRMNGAEPPVILISAHDSSAVRNKAKQGGAAGYLAKPFAGTALVAEVERLAEAVRSRGMNKGG